MKFKTISLTKNPMKITRYILLFALFASTARLEADQPASPALRSAAKESVMGSEALEKVNQLILKFNARWANRDLTPAEKSQSEQEKSELLPVMSEVKAANAATHERFKSEVDKAGIVFPSNVTYLQAARQIASTGRIPDSWGSDGSGGSSSEYRGLTSLSAEVLRKGTDPSRGIANAGKYVLYTVQVRASLDGPARQPSSVSLTSRGSDDLAAAITGNNGITFKPGQSSASARFTISARPGQRVEIEGWYQDLSRSTTESTSFYAK